MKFPIWLAALPMMLAVSCLPFTLIRDVVDPPPPAKVVCTAHYTLVLPNTAVGTDSCGNRWLWQDGRCWYYLPKDGIVVEITCPAEGDTTYSE